MPGTRTDKNFDTLPTWLHLRTSPGSECAWCNASANCRAVRRAGLLQTSTNQSNPSQSHSSKNNFNRSQHHILHWDPATFQQNPSNSSKFPWNSKFITVLPSSSPTLFEWQLSTNTQPQKTPFSTKLSVCHENRSSHRKPLIIPFFPKRRKSTRTPPVSPTRQLCPRLRRRFSSCWAPAAKATA